MINVVRSGHAFVAIKLIDCENGEHTIIVPVRIVVGCRWPGWHRNVRVPTWWIRFRKRFFFLSFLFLTGVRKRNFLPSLSLGQWSALSFIRYRRLRRASGRRLLSVTDRMSTGPAISGLVNSIRFHARARFAFWGPTPPAVS